MSDPEDEAVAAATGDHEFTGCRNGIPFREDSLHSAGLAHVNTLFQLICSDQEGKSVFCTEHWISDGRPRQGSHPSCLATRYCGNS